MSGRIHHARSTGSFGEHSATSDRLLGPGEEPRLASHLISPRTLYTHHGIYVGNGRVIHYAGLAQGMRRGPVEDVSLERFAGGHGVRIRREPRRFCRREVVQRARSRLGERRYRILTNNCEHFCAWAVRGEFRSGQVERFRFALTALLRLTNWLIRQAFGQFLASGEPQPILWCNRVTPALVMGSARNDKSDRRPREQCRPRNWGTAHARAILDPYRTRHVVVIGILDTWGSIGAGSCRAASKSHRRNNRYRAEKGTVGQYRRHVDHRRYRRRAGGARHQLGR